MFFILQFRLMELKEKRGARVRCTRKNELIFGQSSRELKGIASGADQHQIWRRPKRDYWLLPPPPLLLQLLPKVDILLRFPHHPHYPN
jgi:hypothetical protein